MSRRGGGDPAIGRLTSSMAPERMATAISPSDHMPPGKCQVLVTQSTP